MERFAVVIVYGGLNYFGKPKTYDECEVELSLYNDNLKKYIINYKEIEKWTQIMKNILLKKEI